MANSKIMDDPRIDPRIKAVFGEMDFSGMTPDAKSRQELVDKANSDESKAAQEMLRAFLDNPMLTLVDATIIKRLGEITKVRQSGKREQSESLTAQGDDAMTFPTAGRYR